MTMRGTLAGFFALMMWASSAYLMAHLGRLPPVGTAAFSWVVSVVMLTGYFLFKRENIISYFRRPLGDYLFVCAGIGFFTILYYISFKYAPVFEANSLNYLWPIFLLIFLNVFQNEKMTLLKILGMILGFCGCVIIFLLPEDGAKPFQSFGIGHITAVLGALLWAWYSCFAKNKTYPTGFLIPVFLFSGLLTFGLHFITEPPVIPDKTEWIVILLIGFARLGYVFWDYGMRHGNQSLITSASYFTPLFSTIILIAGGYGTHNPGIAFGGAMIIAGCLLSNGQAILRIVLRQKSS